MKIIYIYLPGNITLLVCRLDEHWHVTANEYLAKQVYFNFNVMDTVLDGANVTDWASRWYYVLILATIMNMVLAWLRSRKIMSPFFLLNFSDLDTT